MYDGNPTAQGTALVQIVVALSGIVMTEKRMCPEVREMVAPVCCPLLHGMAVFVPF